MAFTFLIKISIFVSKFIRLYTLNIFRVFFVCMYIVKHFMVMFSLLSQILTGFKVLQPIALSCLLGFFVFFLQVFYFRKKTFVNPHLVLLAVPSAPQLDPFSGKRDGMEMYVFFYYIYSLLYIWNFLP